MLDLDRIQRTLDHGGGTAGLLYSEVADLLRIARAVREWGEAREAVRKTRTPWRDGHDAYRARCDADTNEANAMLAVRDLSDTLARKDPAR